MILTISKLSSLEREKLRDNRRLLGEKGRYAPSSYGKAKKKESILNKNKIKMPSDTIRLMLPNVPLSVFCQYRLNSVASAQGSIK